MLEINPDVLHRIFTGILFVRGSKLKVKWKICLTYNTCQLMCLPLIYDIFVCICISLKCWNILKEFDPKSTNLNSKVSVNTTIILILWQTDKTGRWATASLDWLTQLSQKASRLGLLFQCPNKADYLMLQFYFKGKGSSREIKIGMQMETVSLFHMLIANY